MLQIDTLSYRSKLRFIHPTEKIFFELTLLCLCVAWRTIFLSVVTILINTFILLQLSKLAWKDFKQLMLLPVSFLVLSGLAILLQITSELPATPYVMIGNLYFTTSMAQFLFTLKITVVALAGITCLLSIAVTTPLNDCIFVLRKYRCPILLVELLVLVYRFIFVMLATAKQMIQAQQVRLGTITFRRAIHSFALLSSQLFLKSYLRANQLYVAMEARGYDGTIHVIEIEQTVHKKRVVVMICLIMLLVGVQFWVRW